MTMKIRLSAPQKNFFYALLIPWVALTGCGKEPVAWSVPSSEGLPVVVEPLITRVVGTAFEAGDRIGLQISNSEGVYAANQPLSYSGSYFMAQDFIWYNNINLKAELTAYYPYTAGDALPTTHAVAADQSSEASLEASDLLAAVRSDIAPSADPIEMVFSHLMSKIQINLTNNSDGEVTGLQLGSSRLEADLDLAGKSATVKGSAAAAAITPHTLTAGSAYEAIVVPQQVAFTVSVTTDDGKVHTHQMVSTTLTAAKIYTINLTLTNIDLSASLSADIDDWTSGGEIAEEAGGSVSNDPENQPDNSTGSGSESSTTLSYEGVDYAIATLADGRVWMVENLRYDPSTQGVYQPGESLSAEEYGLLYTAAAALGVAEITSENKDSLEGSQGVCPDGWHIPSEAEVSALFTAYGTYPEELRFLTPYYWASSTSKYVSQDQKGNFLTSTPTLNLGTSNIQIAVIYGDGEASTTKTSNTNAYPVRCIKNE